MRTVCWKIEVCGIVQGVGFRPFVYRLATEMGLTGRIRNTASGAELTAEGPEPVLRRFAEALRKAPPPAVVERLCITTLPGPARCRDFAIAPSADGTRQDTLISPDLGICPDCLRELNDPNDPRYRYPFINCTACGPRFTIVNDVPYDRERTVMAGFALCPRCAGQYADPNDRRYHAQPVCCPECGPALTLCGADGVPVPGGDPIVTAQAWLREGKILAVKGLGGFHLACLAEPPEAAERLRRRKMRDGRPFALMCRDVAAARRLCFVSDQEAEALLSPRRPIVLLRRREPAPDHLSENGSLGLMLPYTPLHALLFDGGPDVLVMTSANLAGLPIVTENDEALRKLSGVADGFLLHNRDIAARCDDSLIWIENGRTQFIRRSRGWVPAPVFVPGCPAALLACGAEQKASFCLSRPGAVFPSQHIGDLKNAETLDVYAGQIDRFRRLFGITPRAVACDGHPDYFSTAYAEQLAERENIPLVRVQHHHAHMASCMADNDLDGEVLGLIWDGTGLGADGTIWGGELLCGGYASFRRLGTIRPIPLPGGDRVTDEIWRVGLALLQQTDVPQAQELFPQPAAQAIGAMLASGVGCPLSHGMGRLFDGVCAVAGIRQTCSYEGQGAVLLEAAIGEPAGHAPYPLPVSSRGGLYEADWRPMLRQLAADRRRGVAAGEMSERFHNALMEAAAALCRAGRTETGLDRVVLSGGVFQNRYLTGRLCARLQSEGFQVFTHSRVSTNDEGLCLGQLMVAAHSGVL